MLFEVGESKLLVVPIIRLTRRHLAIFLLAPLSICYRYSSVSIHVAVEYRKCDEAFQGQALECPFSHFKGANSPYTPLNESETGLAKEAPGFLLPEK